MDAARDIRDGRITSVELVTACLDRIEKTDGDVGAWAFLDRDLTLEQAAAMDDLRRNGRPIGALHGVPVAILDVFDCKAMPTAIDTANGADAAVVEKLYEAGAVIIGKLDASASRYTGAGKTRNPHDRGRASGGPSGAAVAAGHVPLAVGGLAAGSTIQSASYCGVVGFKPTRGLISRRGAPTSSATFDQVGLCGRTLEDVAALCDALTGFDAADSATHARPKPPVLSGCRAEVPVEPCFAWLGSPVADQISAAVRGGLEELMDSLGGHVESVPAPVSLGDLERCGAIAREYEFRQFILEQRPMAPDHLDPGTRMVFDRAGLIEESEYDRALALVGEAGNSFDAFFKDFDAIIAPATIGEAPAFDVQSGLEICSDLWSVAGLPCVSLPWLTGDNNLPAGVQLIGSAEEDDRLLRTAAWLERYLTAPESAASG